MPSFSGSRSVHQNVGARLHLALIERAARHRVAGAANVAAVGWHRVHRDRRRKRRPHRHRGAAVASAPSPYRLFAFPPLARYNVIGCAPCRRPGVGRLPLVQPHGEVADLGRLLQNVVVLALQEMVEPAVSQRVVIQPRVAHVALADHGVFRGALVAAMQRRRDHRVLLVARSRASRSCARSYRPPGSARSTRHTRT